MVSINDSGKGSSPDLTPDEIATKLAPAGSGARPKTLLDGFVADSGTAGVVRLFCTPEFSSYVDIAEKDVLHREKLQATGQSPEASRLWLDPHARVTRSRSSVEELQARYLTGSLTAEGMASAVSSQPITSGLRYSPSEPTYQQTLNQHIPACNTAPGHSPCNGGYTLLPDGYCNGTQPNLCGPPAPSTNLSCPAPSVKGGPACNY